ncbi:discoidin domain-containing protein [Saccharothrix deserti]|uniref:discoidin domain-containing protein n=1 Tax=Saccharothrix deserti TaxID=2593674 RepID=UPI00192E6D59|nr:discoidin domain-containing protein [Saccharothrix deserti]
MPLGALVLSLIAVPPAATAAATNLALNKPATGSAACAGTEGPEKAVNGSVSGGLGDKWCSPAGSKYLQVDLGAAASITGFTVKHAGAGGESTTYNTKAFTISLSTDGSTWTSPVTVTNNTSSTTTHSITATNARYAKLIVTTPTQSSDSVARIYEFEVYGTGGGTPGGGTITVFDRIPQFGIYTSDDPANYTPPAGVLMWNRGTEFARKLTDAEKGLIGGDLRVRVSYHAQCDNYDRIGTVFYVAVPKGTTPTATTPRVTLQDFITPFSNYWRGAKANYTFPDADLGPYAGALADPNKDVYLGIGGGSNPYRGDACESHPEVDADFRAIGFKYSMSLISTTALSARDHDVAGMISGVRESTNSITAGPVTHTAAGNRGDIALVIAGYGSAAGGEEYSNTTVTVSVNGTRVGSFSTAVDCASLEQYSPDGNPGIFRNNTTTNPRSWCPGGLIPSRYFPTGDITGKNVTVTVGIGRPVPYVGDSGYRTSVSLLEH